MEIKVQCDCGQKFKFDVEPVHGRMPFTVNCPVCGADGTARANVLLQQLLPPAPLATAYAPPPPPLVAAPAPAPMRPAGLSINRPQAPAPASPAQTDEDTEADEDNDDDSKSGGVRVVNLGWKGWAIIVLLILLAAGGSYLKSAQRSFVRDTLDWVWGKVTGEHSTASETVDYQALDKEAEIDIKSPDAAEARDWLANPEHGIFEGDKAEVIALMENFYKAGCPKVHITGIEKLGGSSVSASMVVTLPSGTSERQNAFNVAKEFSEKHGEQSDPDKGQKYILFTFD